MKSYSPASPLELSAASAGKIPGIPSTLPLGGGGTYSAANRRNSPGGSDRIYPILLIFSTLLAGTFCFLYITKPVRIVPTAITPVSHPPAIKPTPPAAATAKPIAPGILLPGEASLPGEKKTASSPPAEVPATSPFEETNLRIQHVLNAESPDGEISRIVLNVPVLYQSRNLRWTLQDVAEARVLLNRLADYQEKSVALRSEGAALLASWNHLVEKSIPSQDVRADSPSLPANQQGAAASPQPAELSTPQSIQLQPADK